MSAGSLVKRLRAASRRLPIGAVLAAALALASSARPRSPPTPSRPIGPRARSMRRGSLRRAAIWRASRSGSRPARSPIGAIQAIPACRRPSIFLVRTMSRRSSRRFRRRSASGRPTAARRSATTAASIFPLRVQPRDAAKPVTLALQADFAVCEKVCLPAKARLTLTLPTAAASPYAGAIDAALAAVPRARSAEGFRRAFARRRRKLAPLRAARRRSAARPVRRAAGRLVADGRAYGR